MKIAVFADVHSNFLGLKAVLDDIEQRGIRQVYCAGDLVGYGPRPNEVITLLRQKGVSCIMGNYDDAIGNMRLICGCNYKDEGAAKLGERSILWTKEHTSDENKAWLRDLPERIEFSLEGLRFLLVHGSPRELNEYLFESTPDQYLNELLEQNHCNVLLCGHTHLPYHKSLDKGHVVNVGSAGKPKHGNPNVQYTILDVKEGNLRVELIELSYDFEKTAGEIEDFGLPTEFAQIIRTGQ